MLGELSRELEARLGDQIQPQPLPNCEQAKAPLYALVPWSAKYN